MSCAELQQPTITMRFFVLGGRIGAPEKAEEWQRRSPAKVEMPGMWDGKLGFLGGKVSSQLRMSADSSHSTVLTQNDL